MLIDRTKIFLVIILLISSNLYSKDFDPNLDLDLYTKYTFDLADYQPHVDGFANIYVCKNDLKSCIVKLYYYSSMYKIQYFFTINNDYLDGYCEKILYKEPYTTEDAEILKLEEYLMKTSDFYYDLPQELIAQTPMEPRDMSRLMVIDKNTGEIEHKIFKDLIDYLRPGDCLILNDTRVIPARIYGVKKGTESKVEILLLKDMGDNKWEVLVKPGKKCKVGTVLEFGKKENGEALIEATVLDILEDGNRIVE